MPAKQITLEEPYIACQNQLGEGCLWDPKTGLLHWVDIKRSQIHTVEPKTGYRSIDDYSDVDEMITSLVLRSDKPGVGCSTDYFKRTLTPFISSSSARIPLTSLSFPKPQSPQRPTLPPSSGLRHRWSATRALRFRKSTRKTRRMELIGSTTAHVMRSGVSGASLFARSRVN